MRLKLKTPLPGLQAQREMAPVYRKPSLLLDMPGTAVESAVLALLFPANEGRSREELLDWKVLLIRRNSYPGVHSGQISFPGGKREARDADLWETARRETCEEVGICREWIDTVGPLTATYVPASNFAIHPFVGVARPGATVTMDPREVAACRRVPLRALDPARAVMRRFTYEDGEKPAPAWLYEDFVIWGATAMVLAELYRAVDRGLLARE